MKKLIAIIVATLMEVFFLSGCAFFNSEPSPSPSPSETVQQTATPTPTMSMTPMGSPSPSVSPSPSPTISSDPVTYEKNKIEFEYYDVVKDRMVTAVYEFEGEGTIQTAIDAVNEVYIKGVLGDAGLKTNSIVYKDGNIYIDFTDSIYNLNLGSGGETGVLESIADAYLNNVEGIKAVYFSVNGYDYSSGHIEFSKNEPYKTK